MALPRISWNSKTIDFPFDVYRQQIEYPHVKMVNFSASRKAETLNVSADVMVNLAFRILSNTTDAALKRNLYQWAEWAMLGNSWTFARDSSKVSNTTLTATAAAGVTSLTVSSISGLSNGDLCILRTDTFMELVKISGAPSGTTVNLADTTNFAYPVGARFRHELFWPARLLNAAHPIQEKPPLNYDVNLTFTEDWN